jgi:hypothetical protein
MFLLNSRYVLAIVATSSLFGLSSAADHPRIAGYKPTADVNEVVSCPWLGVMRVSYFRYYQ